MLKKRGKIRKMEIKEGEVEKAKKESNNKALLYQAYL